MISQGKSLFIHVIVNKHITGCKNHSIWAGGLQPRKNDSAEASIALARTGCSRKHSSVKPERRHDISHVVVQDISRLARNLGTQNEVITMLGKLGIVLASASEPHIENVTAAGRFGANLLGATAQFQSDASSDSIRKRMKYAAQSGRFLHRAPIEYLNSSMNGIKNITPDAEGAPLVQKIFESMAFGMPAESVRKQITAPVFALAPDARSRSRGSRS